LSLPIASRIKAFSRLGDFLREYLLEAKNQQHSFSRESLAIFDEAVHKAYTHNPWFTIENQMFALASLAQMLEKPGLERWVSQYNITENVTPKKIGVIMAGNIPMVGFHDFLCVLMAGHSFAGKLSSSDTILLPALANILIETEPAFTGLITFEEGRLSGYDAVIATGSNNSFRYFEYYFRDIPAILRKNRNGIAVISGEESDAELEGLADDIFLYFGMGCRSVTKVFVPKAYDVRRLFVYFNKYEGLAQHNKYRNNYDYYKSIYLINGGDFYEAGLVLFKPSAGMNASPVSVVYYEEYETVEQISGLVNQHLDEIQCVVSKLQLPGSVVPFGKSQEPGLSDYADGVDVMEFLLK